MPEKRVLVFPRKIFEGGPSFQTWGEVREQIQEIERSFRWMERTEAERSASLVQAITCTFIQDSAGGRCVLRRAAALRTDMSRRLSLIVGGHIDEEPGPISFMDMLAANLKRELEEELAMPPGNGPAQPEAVMIDNLSVDASRHVAFLHGMITHGTVRPRPGDEFNRRSNLSGRFMTPSELTARIGEFDPWSRMLIRERIDPGADE